MDKRSKSSELDYDFMYSMRNLFGNCFFDFVHFRLIIISVVLNCKRQLRTVCVKGHI